MSYILHIAKWDIRPEKQEEYDKKAPGWIKTVMSLPGPVEFRAYRPASGSFQVIITTEFPDIPTWSTWYMNGDVQATFDDIRTCTTGMTFELWGPSPIVPKPVLPFYHT